MIERRNLADRHERLRDKHEPLRGPQVRDRVLFIGDAHYLRTYSGQLTWAVLVNLTARLYKGIREIRLVLDHDPDVLPHVFFANDCSKLRAATLQLLISLSDGTMDIAEGLPTVDKASYIEVYVGGAAGADNFSVAGQGWLAFIGDDSWKSLHPELNPIGPIAAACFATAEVYRRIYIADAVFRPFVFSAFDYSLNSRSNPPFPSRLQLPRTYIAGTGAVGMALLLTLLCAPGVTSPEGVFAVDFDPLEDTNINRCILALIKDIGELKTDIIRSRVPWQTLNLHLKDAKWGDFVNDPQHSEARHFEFVLSCVDKYEARRSVQYDRMPKVLLTAGTSDFLLSVSRHALHADLSCGICYQARDATPACATASNGTQQAFEVPIDPSIGFVSVLAGMLLGAEFLKEINPAWHWVRVQNTVRVTLNVLAVGPKTKLMRRGKDPQCNCSSKYVALGYREIWGSPIDFADADALL